MAVNSDDRIFLCHASEDKNKVAEIHKRLESSGLNPWIDKEDIPPARDWDEEIAKTIQAARFVLIFFSDHLISKSGYVQREIEIALDTSQDMPKDTTFIIPVRWNECRIPDGFDHLKRIDLFEKKGFDELVELIKAELRLFTDPRDGQIYKTIVIGGQTWLAENLNYEVKDSRWYDNDPGNGKPYGRLYTWEAAQEACPDGWHIPSDSEWRNLATNCGGYKDMDEGYPGAGMKIGSPNAAFESLVLGGKSRFDAPLGGYCDSAGHFFEYGRAGFYWSGTQYEYSDLGTFEPLYTRQIKTAWMYYFYLLSGVPELRRDSQFRQRPDPHPRACGLSARCVKD